MSDEPLPSGVLPHSAGAPIHPHGKTRTQRGSESSGVPPDQRVYPCCQTKEDVEAHCTCQGVDMGLQGPQSARNRAELWSPDWKQRPIAAAHQREPRHMQLRPGQTAQQQDRPPSPTYLCLSLSVSPSFSLSPKQQLRGGQGARRSSAKANGNMSSPGTPGPTERPK